MGTTQTFNFSKVVLGTQIDLALVGQASIEGFLSPGASEDLTNQDRKVRNKQEALALLVLFDEVILPDAVGGNYEIPILEQEGILQIDRGEQLLVKDFEESDWARNRNPDVFVRCLDRTVSVRPLVLEYLVRRRFEFVDELALSLGFTRKELLNSIRFSAFLLSRRQRSIQDESNYSGVAVKPHKENPEGFREPITKKKWLQFY